VAEQPDRLSDELAEVLRRARADELRGTRRRGGLGVGFDPRPTSPTQVMIVGGALILAQWLRLYSLVGLGRAAPTLASIGLILLIFGVVTWLMRPPRRDMYWRGRRIELQPSGAWHHRLYAMLYRDR
jgi:hypothetical protein